MNFKNIISYLKKHCIIPIRNIFQTVFISVNMQNLRAIHIRFFCCANLKGWEIGENSLNRKHLMRVQIQMKIVLKDTVIECQQQLTEE